MSNIETEDLTTNETQDLVTNEVNEENAAAEDSQEDKTQEEYETGNVAQGDAEQREKLVRLPLGRMKTIIKMDPEVNMVNQEAVFLITKSTEFFIESLAKEAYKYTTQAKKKTIQKRDVESAINNVDALVFLEGTLD